MNGSTLEISTTGLLVTIGLIVGLLALDLALAAARPHAVGFKEAVGVSARSRQSRYSSETVSRSRGRA
jgi:hypothetical protein